MNEQLDLICTQCPLAVCDEESLFCCFRWATNPNAEQRKVIQMKPITKVLAALSNRKRLKQQAAYREANRERKRAYDRARYAERKASHSRDAREIDKKEQRCTT